MATKTISIMEDVYDILSRNKRKDESFSEELRRLVGNKGSIMDCAGAWSDISDEQAKRMENAIKKSRDYTIKHSRERLK